MCRQTSVLNKIAFSLFILGCLAAALSFCAPFWVRIPYNLSLTQGVTTTYRGLWGMCCPDDQQSTGFSCAWVWYDHYSLDSTLPPCSWLSSTFSSKTDLPGWYTAAEVIYCVALGFLFISILLESIYNCCRCCKNPTCFPTSVAAFAFAGAVLVGLSLGIYGGFSYKEEIFTPVMSGGRGGQLEWAFYVGIAGAGTCTIAAIMYFIDGCIQTKHYRGYKSPALGTQSN